MAKNLYHSNRAHERMRTKHQRVMSSSTGNRRKTAIIKADYHDEAISMQSNMCRVLSHQEKQWVWNRANKRYKLSHKNQSVAKKTKASLDYTNNFNWTPSGRIKGSYTADGYFEPD